jgi:hypothetical protein
MGLIKIWNIMINLNEVKSQEIQSLKVNQRHY